MDSSSEVLGWSKNVLAEDDDGKHEWLTALYCCRSLVEAVTLESLKLPTHLKHGDEVLMRCGSGVYSAESGRMFVVFNWRTQDGFAALDLDSRF